MSEILRLVKIGFDSLENNNPRYEETIGIFTNTKGSFTGYYTAHGNIRKWFETQPPFKLYLGYDGQVYPQWKIIHEQVKNP